MNIPTILLLLAASAAGQFLHPDPKDSKLRVVQSPGGSNVTISFKQTEGVCNTLIDSQKQYTGWVNIPGEYPTNLFFWFIEARSRTDKFTIWLNGGPGYSSMAGLFGGVGPCKVLEKGLNKYDTEVNEWGWDTISNLLFIDQPNQVGFSYDTPTNGTLDLVYNSVSNPPSGYHEKFPEYVQLNGTFSSLYPNSANTSQLAALGTWHLLQGFFSVFPQYHKPSKDSVDVNLFAESYGGRYGPVFAEVWGKQNYDRHAGQLNQETTIDVHLTSLGIINGCIDPEIEYSSYPRFGAENTYGFPTITKAAAHRLLSDFESPGGCRDRLRQCMTVSQAEDPGGQGNISLVNQLCSRADTACNRILYDYHFYSGRSIYDIASFKSNPNPSQLFVEYLNLEAVQRAIETPVNYTALNRRIQYGFTGTGDVSRGGNIARLSALLDQGVRIGLIYGDRDFICNWFAGEAVSLEIANQAGRAYSQFSASGYAQIEINDTYIGGVVRQYGNLSFSRVYQAGHSVASYQPETAFRLFSRISRGTSLGTGRDVKLSTYGTTGPRNSTNMDRLPEPPKPTCYVRAFEDTCDDDAIALMRSHKGVVINGVLYSSSADWSLMSKTGDALLLTEPTGSSAKIHSPMSTKQTNAANLGLPSLTLWLLACLGLASCLWV